MKVMRSTALVLCVALAVSCSSADEEPDPAERSEPAPAARAPRDAPRIDARVTQVRPEPAPGAITLSVGADHKVEEGLFFYVYRGSKYVGKVVVRSVLDDCCGCIVVRLGAGESIEVGDSATSRLD